MAKFNVGTLAQKVIFHFEMKGQISDGMWENTAPHHHWHYANSIKFDETEVNPDNIGLDPNAPLEYTKFDRHYRLKNGYRKVTSQLGWAPKRSYSFNNKELLDIVGERLITKVLCYLNGDEQTRNFIEKDHWTLPESLKEFDDIIRRAEKNSADPENYYVEKLLKLKENNITREKFENMLSGKKPDGTTGTQYTIKNLRKDCSELSKAFKTNQQAA